jgi:flagellin FlaB
MKKNEAFSGLEAAIVLIAFVVVAAVFSYVMLGAGFFATQKSQEVTYSGIKQSTSNLVLDGQLYGDAATVTLIEFNIAIAEGSQPQLLSEIEYISTSSNNPTPVEATSTYYEQDGTTTIPKSTVLKPGEKVMVKVGMAPTVTGGDSFTIEMKPKIGAATLISKTLSTGYPGGLII